MKTGLNRFFLRLAFLPALLLFVTAADAQVVFPTVTTSIVDETATSFAGQSTVFDVSWTITPVVWTPGPYIISYTISDGPNTGSYVDFQSGSTEGFDVSLTSYCSALTCNMSIPVIYATPGSYLASIAVVVDYNVSWTYGPPEAIYPGYGDDAIYSGQDASTLAVQVYAPLEAVPEPHPYAMLLAGLCVAGVAVRRRERKLYS